MHRHLLLALLLALHPAAAQEAHRVIVVADLSDQAQVQLENHLIAALAERDPIVIDAHRPEGAALLAGWGLTPTDLPLLGLLGPNNALAWQWEVGDVAEALAALSAQLDGPAPRIRAADFSPRHGPLAAGQEITITLQGEPGGVATASVGGVQGIALFELQPGLYRGSYTVGPEDRTDARVSVTLNRETRELGSIVLEGLQAPSLQTVRQVGANWWVFTGTAPPNSQVSIRAVVSQTFIFKITESYDFQGVADASGRFQIEGSAPDTLAGSEATFTVAGKGGTSEARLVFQGYGRTPDPGPGSSPWALAGRWWHQGRATSIRVGGTDSVIIRNEHGQETQLWYTGPATLSARGPLSGTIADGGRTIRWSNGTRWTR